MRGPVGGLLLTGGASRRMGAPKALLPIGGSTVGQRLADLLITTAAPVLEVGPGLTTLESVADDEPGAGPLAAVATGWAALTPRPEAVIVLACDLPQLSHAFLVRLAAARGDGAVVPEVDGRLQPLCARYPAAMLDLAKGLVRDGVRSMQDLLATGPFTVLPAGRWAEVLADVDTPEDMERLGLPGPGAKAARLGLPGPGAKAARLGLPGPGAKAARLGLPGSGAKAARLGLPGSGAKAARP